MSSSQKAYLQFISEMSLEEATKERSKQIKQQKNAEEKAAWYRRKAENAERRAGVRKERKLACETVIVAKDEEKICYHSNTQPHTFMTALEYMNNMA